MQNFMKGNFDVFNVFQLDCHLFCKHYNINNYMVKDNDHPSKYLPSNFHKVIIHQNFPLSILCTKGNQTKTAWGCKKGAAK